MTSCSNWASRNDGCLSWRRATAVGLAGSGNAALVCGRLCDPAVRSPRHAGEWGNRPGATERMAGHEQGHAFPARAGQDPGGDSGALGQRYPGVAGRGARPPARRGAEPVRYAAAGDGRQRHRTCRAAAGRQPVLPWYGNSRRILAGLRACPCGWPIWSGFYSPARRCWPIRTSPPTCSPGGGGKSNWRRGRGGSSWFSIRRGGWSKCATCMTGCCNCRWSMLNPINCCRGCRAGSSWNCRCSRPVPALPSLNWRPIARSRRKSSFCHRPRGADRRSRRGSGG